MKNKSQHLKNIRDAVLMTRPSAQTCGANARMADMLPSEIRGEAFLRLEKGHQGRKNKITLSSVWGKK